MKTAFVRLWITLGLLSLWVSAEEPEFTTTQLLENAAAVINKAYIGENIEASKQSDIVFRAAERLQSEGKPAEAIKYYEQALRLSPWALERYMGYVETLQVLDRKDKANHWARSALQRAEDIETREKARLWLKEKEPAKLRPYGLHNEPRVICLVRIGEPPDWLLHRCGIGLQNVLGVPVMILDERIALPRPHRSAFSRWVGQLRRDIKWEDPGLRQFLRLKGLPTSEWTDLEVLQVMEALLRETRPAEELENFRRLRLQLSQSKYDGQWDVQKLIDVLAQLARQTDDKSVIWLGITSVDLYSGDSNYCFGAAAGPPACAVNSSARFKADFNGEPPSADRLCHRLLKQMLSSVGTLLGAARPIDPTCPRSYPQSLAEQDAKTLNLCGDCRSSLAKILGHEVPSLSEKLFEPVAEK